MLMQALIAGKTNLFFECDALTYGVGAALCHVMSSGEELPITFASHTMSKAETNNAQLDREALSVMFGLKRSHLYLFGRRFEIYTHHKLLLGLLGESKVIQLMSSTRMQRWALTLSAYSYTLKHIRGPENTLAGTLSMLPIVDNSPEKTPPFEVVNLL